MIIDEKNVIILERLQKDSRASLTEIASEVNLSVDSVKKRILKLEKNRVFYPRIQMRPRQFGFSNFIEVNMKLGNEDEKSFETFTSYLINHPRVTQIIQLSGSWDLRVTIMAKNIADQEMVTKEIKRNFSNIISEWNESLTMFVLKFETYDLKKLMGYE